MPGPPPSVRSGGVKALEIGRWPLDKDGKENDEAPTKEKPDVEKENPGGKATGSKDGRKEEADTKEDDRSEEKPKKERKKEKPLKRERRTKKEKGILWQHRLFSIFWAKKVWHFLGRSANWMVFSQTTWSICGILALAVVIALVCPC